MAQLRRRQQRRAGLPSVPSGGALQPARALVCPLGSPKATCGRNAAVGERVFEVSDRPRLLRQHPSKVQKSREA